MLLNNLFQRFQVPRFCATHIHSHNPFAPPRPATFEHKPIVAPSFCWERIIALAISLLGSFANGEGGMKQRLRLRA